MTVDSLLEKYLPHDGVGDRALDEVRLELSSLDIGRVTVAYLGNKEPFYEFDLEGTHSARIIALEHSLSKRAKILPWTPLLMFVSEAAYETGQQRLKDV